MKLLLWLSAKLDARLFDCWPAISSCRMQLQETHCCHWCWCCWCLMATGASLQLPKVVPSNWIRADDENGPTWSRQKMRKRKEGVREARKHQDRIHKAIRKGRKWVAKSSSRTSEWRVSADEISLPTFSCHCSSLSPFFVVVFSAFFNFFGERTKLNCVAQLMVDRQPCTKNTIANRVTATRCKLQMANRWLLFGRPARSVWERHSGQAEDCCPVSLSKKHSSDYCPHP